MSKAFIAAVLQDSLGCTAGRAARAADDVIQAIVGELKRDGVFTVPGFGRFVTADRAAAQKLNPRTQEPVLVAASRTVRFKASPVLRELVDDKPAKAQAVAKTPERKGAGRGGNSGGKPVSRAAARRADSRA